MAVTISIMYVVSLGPGKISIIWRPLFRGCVSLRMLSILNTFNQMGILFLLIPNLPPCSPPCLGCGIITLLQLSISWHCIICVYLLQIAFVIFATAELTFVVCSQSTARAIISQSIWQKGGIDVVGVSLNESQVADLTAHFYTNTFDKAREAIFQEALKAAEEEVKSLI
jgi:hypothetical protein